MHGLTKGVRLHHLEVEAGEGRSEPGGVSVLHAAERSGGGELAKPRVGACVSGMDNLIGGERSKANPILGP